MKDFQLLLSEAKKKGLKIKSFTNIEGVFYKSSVVAFNGKYLINIQSKTIQGLITQLP